MGDTTTGRDSEGRSGVGRPAGQERPGTRTAENETPGEAGTARRAGRGAAARAASAPAAGSADACEIGGGALSRHRPSQGGRRRARGVVLATGPSLQGRIPVPPCAPGLTRVTTPGSFLPGPKRRPAGTFEDTHTSSGDQ
jgi:hypothetical protein